jgi:endonuclease/exonuclease/phosphatase family metal-dependent hydrolase
MKRKTSKFFIAILSAVCLFPVVIAAQGDSIFRVVCWNVENLFDTRHDSLKRDEDFLPTSPRRWHDARYKEKLSNVARAIATTAQCHIPALVGLCEVENENVMRDLTRHSLLKEYDYRYVMTHSPDIRGIDVALLYRHDRFKLIDYQSLRICSVDDIYRPTRDILHVTGLLINGDTLDVFVCHFPSRLAGVKKTEPHRLLAARILRNAVDSLFAIRFRPQIIVMGDLNDYPHNKSVTNVLAAVAPSLCIERDRLYHLLARKAEETDYGSYKHKGKWGLFDHLIVSGLLLDVKNRLYTHESKADIVRFPFLLMNDEKYGGVRPFRTYSGIKYWGGFSDHLPVYVDFIIHSKYELPR